MSRERRASFISPAVGDEVAERASLDDSAAPLPFGVSSLRFFVGLERGDPLGEFGVVHRRRR